MERSGWRSKWKHKPNRLKSPSPPAAANVGNAGSWDLSTDFPLCHGGLILDLYGTGLGNRIADDANKVAKEALDVARKAEEGERSAREQQVQALQVSWYDGEREDGTDSVVIVNRNPESIYDVELTFDEGSQKPTYVTSQRYTRHPLDDK